LCIISLLKNGLRPSVIAAKSGVNKTTLQRHLTHLKKQGLVIKIGYGVWEVVDLPESTKKRSIQSIYVAKNTPPSEVRQNLHMFIPDSVRAHAFRDTLQVPQGLTNWTNEKRELYLEDHQIPFKTLGIIGGGQRLLINGRITHLTNKSIVIYDRSSYFAEKAIEAKSNAVHSFISIVKKLERTLHTDLTSGSDYKFRVSRQHYALVKNALAQQYNADGERLEIRSEGDNSLWFLIDNSFNLDEAEAVHPKTGMTDVEKVQKFFNSVKDTGETIHTILEPIRGIIQVQATNTDAISQVVGSQMAMAANTDSHLTLISQIDTGIKGLSAGLQTFNSLLEKLFQKLEGGDP
jgi:DNA-binding transcriptional regulator YhcF (GntR family)